MIESILNASSFSKVNSQNFEEIKKEIEKFLISDSYKGSALSLFRHNTFIPASIYNCKTLKNFRNIRTTHSKSIYRIVFYNDD
jgi:hypothetical protein